MCFSSSEVSLIVIELKKFDRNRTNFCHVSDNKDNINDYGIGRWRWVASSTGASYYFGIWLGRGLLCLQQVRDGWAIYFILFFFFISSILSSFSNASSVGRRLDILKYCGLCGYNPAVVVSYYRRCAR